MKTDTLKPTVQRDYRLWLYAVGCALALGLATWAASEFMINALAFDQTITSYTIAVRAADGILTPADLLGWFNGHRYTATNLVTVLVSRFASYNLWVEMAIMLAAAAGMIAVLYRLIRRDFPSARWMIVPAAFLLLTLRGLWTWSYSFQSGFVFMLLFFFLALNQARRSPDSWLSVFICMIYAACATLTQGAGLAVWILTWFTLLLSGASRWKLAAWIAVFVPFMLVYVQGFVGWTENPEYATLAFRSPVMLIQYVFAYLANAFVPFVDEGVRPAMVIGLIGLVLLILNLYALLRQHGLKRDLWARTAVPLSLIGFAVFSATVTGVGRVWYFTLVLIQPLTERYVIHAVPFWIGLGLLMTLNTRFATRSPLIRLTRLLNLIFGLLLIPAYIYAAVVQVTQIPPLTPQDGEACTVRYALFRDRDDPCLRPLLPPDYENYLHVIDGQAERGWTVFSAPALEVPVPAERLAGGAFDLTLPGSYTGALIRHQQAGSETVMLAVFADGQMAAEYEIRPGAAADIDLSAWIGHTIRLSYSPQSALASIQPVIRLWRE
jgi:hypothetical protein